MNLIKSDFFRLSLFSLLTAMEILLAMFLLFHGSESLKPFAIFLLIVQVFSFSNIYFFIKYKLFAMKN